MKSKKFKNIKQFELDTKQRIWLGVAFIALLAIAYQVFVSPWLLQRRQAQTIRAMANAYPELVAGLENATGIELDIKSGCFTTQEKFSSGVSSCQLIAVSEEVSPENEENAKDYFAHSPAGFRTGRQFSNNNGYALFFNDKETCQAVYSSPILIDCRTGYSKANKKLVDNLLSEQRLNQVKDSL